VDSDTTYSKEYAYISLIKTKDEELENLFDQINLLKTIFPDEKLIKDLDDCEKILNKEDLSKEEKIYKTKNCIERAKNDLLEIQEKGIPTYLIWIIFSIIIILSIIVTRKIIKEMSVLKLINKKSKELDKNQKKKTKEKEESSIDKRIRDLQNKL
jgi:hypothetical protein